MGSGTSLERPSHVRIVSLQRSSYTVAESLCLPCRATGDYRLRPIVGGPRAPSRLQPVRCGAMEKRVPSRRGQGVAPSPETPPPRTVAITSNRPMAPAVLSRQTVPIFGPGGACMCRGAHHTTTPHHTPACSQGAPHANHSQFSVGGCAGKTRKRLPAGLVVRQRHATRRGTHTRSRRTRACNGQRLQEDAAVEGLVESVADVHAIDCHLFQAA